MRRLRKLEQWKAICMVGAVRLSRALIRYKIDLFLFAAILLRWVRPKNSVTQKQSTEEPKNILVIRLDCMGDLIMTTPIFRDLKQRFPGAALTVVVRESNRQILASNPFVDRIMSVRVSYKSRLLQGTRRGCSILNFYVKSLRKERFDIALHPRLGADFYGADLLLRLVDAPISVKYSNNTRRGLARQVIRLAFRTATLLPRPQVQHEVHSNAAIVDFVTHNNSSPRPEIFITANDRTFAQHILAKVKAGSTIIGLGFGSLASYKTWPFERWAEVIRLLALHRTVFVFVLCSKDEKSPGERLQSMLNVENILDSGGATLREVAGCLEACDLFLGADSGLGHMAAAVNCATLIVSHHPLSGAMDYSGSPVQWAPYANNSHVIQPEAAIPPCRDGCNAKHPHCILQILPEQVAESCEEILQSIEKSAEGCIA